MSACVCVRVRACIKYTHTHIHTHVQTINLRAIQSCFCCSRLCSFIIFSGAKRKLRNTMHSAGLSGSWIDMALRKQFSTCEMATDWKCLLHGWPHAYEIDVRRFLTRNKKALVRMLVVATPSEIETFARSEPSRTLS